MREGLHAMAVIFGYLGPLYLGLAVPMLRRGYVRGTLAFVRLGIHLLAPIVSTLSFSVP